MPTTQVRKPTLYDHLALQLTRSVLSHRNFSKTTTQSCYLCHKNGTKKKPLKSCSSCKSALYCSLECQRTHWRTHKEYCKESFYEERLVLTDIMIAIGNALNIDALPLPKPPPGLTWIELEARFKKWLLFHAKTLIAAAMHALQIPDDRSTTHVLFIKTKYRNNSVEVAKCFSLIKAEVLTLEEVKSWGGHLMQELEATYRCCRFTMYFCIPA
ncbi:hypothetical protein Agabi119p4_7557 [Agaricus bisporus var. burnettii]|uniref:MYND-type domain-containing protein n=1 Tax=Agaricus bisporus var. burnettii TaxID=192524 RepID=A0A8H7C999_AGABI|nr:hypothetical protein Agabi119p4_7557 [Agaricus bisporus var. burnettii]